MNEKQKEILVCTELALRNHNCPLSADRLIDNFPEVFKKDFKKDVWYLYKHTNVFYRFCSKGMVYQLSMISTYFASEKWNEDFSYLDVDNCEEATQKELEEAFTAVAKRKYPNGKACYFSVSGIRDLDYNDVRFDLDRNIFYVAAKGDFRRIVFEDGKWAEPVKENPPKELTVSEISEMLGYEVKIIK